MAWKRTIRSPQHKKKRRKALIVRFSLAGVAVAALVVGLSFLSKLDAFEIGGFEMQGNAVVSATDIEKTIESEIDGNYLGLFSKKNVLLYPKDSIRERLLAKHAILSEADVSIKGVRTLHIDMKERSPEALWCRFDGGFSDDCFFLDPAGLIYAVAPEFKGEAYAKYYSSLASEPVGQQFLTQERFISLSKFVDGLKLVGLVPLHVYVKDDGEYVVHLRGGGQVLAASSDDLEAALINLGSLLDERGIDKAHAGNLVDYIDLRYGNKIFFKLK